MFVLLALLLCGSVTSAYAGLFGAGGESGLVVKDGVTLSVGSMDMGENTLEIQSGGTVEGSFSFTNGTLIKDSTKQKITGTFDAINNKIILQNGYLRGGAGRITTPIEVRSTGNTIEGAARITQDITFATSSAAALDLHGVMGGNIILDDGVAFIESDLSFSDGHFFVGPGHISSTTRRIMTGDDPVVNSTALDFDNEVSLLLGNSLVVGALWDINGVLNIHGNAQAIDVTAGTLHVDSSALLALHDCALNGVTAARLTFEDDTATLELNNVFMDFDANTALTQGVIKVTGESTLLLRDKTFTFSGTSSLEVDGATLWYDGTQDFLSDNLTNITLSNGGAIRSMTTKSCGEALTVLVDTTLNKSYHLDPLSPLTIGGTGTTVLNGAGHTLSFAHISGDQVLVTNAADGVTTNIVLSDFSPASVSLGTDASLTFSGGTRVVLGKDETLASTLAFSGAATLDGGNYSLDMGTLGEIAVAAGSTLTLKNITLRNVKNTNIRGLANNSSLVFENAILELSDDYTFGQGSLAVSKQLLIMGPYTFEYATAQQSTINAFSKLVLDTGVTFHYNPTGGAIDRLVLDAATSRLVLSDSVFKIASTGAVLTTGTITIEDTGTLTSLATNLSGALVLGDGLNANANCTVRITPHSTLHINDGIITMNDAVTLGPPAG